jgi:predicted NUDIX family phosphoesterase
MMPLLRERAWAGGTRQGCGSKRPVPGVDTAKAATKTMEHILVIRRDDVFGGAWPQGFVPARTGVAEEVLAAFARNAFAVPRDAAERTPAWKQPIPYCTIVRQTQVFCVERLPRQGEERLHGRLSIGLGGHIDPLDGGHEGGAIRGALHRELREEVCLLPHGSAWPAPHFLGLLNDDASEVGRVHFGVVFAVALSDQADLQIVESSKMRGGFRHLAAWGDPWQDLHRLESWSRILLEARAVEDFVSHSHPVPRVNGHQVARGT